MTDDPGQAPLCLPPLVSGRAPRQRLPAGSWDTHFHVFAGPSALAASRSYTPSPAPLQSWCAMAAIMGIGRGVLVQPSVYGQDNRTLLDALATLPERLRGVVVIPPETPAEEIARLHRLGVRGVRINLRNRSGLPLAAVPGLARLIAPFGWHLQFQAGPGEIAAAARIAADHDVAAVVDHLGFIALDRIGGADDLAALQRLLDTGGVFVKVSAPYRLGAPAAFAAAVSALVASHPERLVWGSDWPHSELFAAMPEDADLIDRFLASVDDAGLRQRVLIDTPQRLYGP